MVQYSAENLVEDQEKTMIKLLALLFFLAQLIFASNEICARYSYSNINCNDDPEYAILYKTNACLHDTIHTQNDTHCNLQWYNYGINCSGIIHFSN